MIEYALLEKLGFENEDIEYIICADKEYGEKIAPVSRLFMESEKDENTRRELSSQMLQRAAETAGECDNVYILQLLFWLYCLPFAKTYYGKIEKHMLKNLSQNDIMSLQSKLNELPCSVN